MKKSLTVINEILSNADAQLLPDSETHKLRIKIKSESSNREYTVSKRDSSGQFECGCMGWTRHFPRKDCKHIRAMRPILEQVEKLMISEPKKQIQSVKKTAKPVEKKIVKKAVKKISKVVKKKVVKKVAKVAKKIVKKKAVKVTKSIAKKKK